MTIIPKSIRQHINKTAHAAGLIAEHEARKRMLAEFERLKAEGCTLAEITEHFQIHPRAGRAA